ncbi:SLBB domain-containing protein [Clostridium sp. SYSU_GA19001]|uniref:SLBB domain-containing protein n=1 Tax=Clostridium caldaquaticum TaxID=2940653 RepID=UPI002076E993|nr:4Fe-4S dicluster domain-containing protein [Clostridium caldaquaticum]MCM8710019.1 SLBB domain-containing protein [Clostridium caldaquaticum]
MDLMEFKKVIFDNGVAGAGGAGFPSHEKLNKTADTIILNCAECEPLFRVDRQLLAKYTENILQTLEIIVNVLEAEKGIVAIKSAYKNTIAAVKSQIQRYEKLEIKILPDVYPAGDEVVLVYETTGRIVPEGAIPLTVGTVVFNVETVLNIFKAVALKEPVTDKYVTVTGEVKNPITIKAPVGISIKELIEFAGGASIAEYEVLNGGPLTGRLADLEDTVGKTTKAIIVLPKEHIIVQKRQLNPYTNLKRTMSVCSQCQMCTDLCPRSLLGHSIKPNRIMKALGSGLAVDIEAFTSSMLCSECGLCEAYSCHQGLSPRMLAGELKRKLRQNGVKNPHHKAPVSVNPMRDGRMVPMERLIARLGISKYNVDAPLSEKDVNIDKVKIYINRHIGQIPVPTVKIGDIVNKGDLIAEVPDGKLGVKFHASISGKVISVEESFISIENGGRIVG